MADDCTLLEETVKMLQDNEKTVDDVEWCMYRSEIGDSFCFSWEEFERLSNFYYDNGFGGVEIIESLKIVGLDFWLERIEYDGSEGWEFKCFPHKPEKSNFPGFLKTR